MALGLEKFYIIGASIWLNIQRTYDLWHAEREIAKDLSRIKTRKVVT